ncbi:serine/threonine protein kinase [Kitasatospora sp. NPDC101801]|uniref:serine/threonine protein kinase n=1 Tax=Kitasatospora sp. NPDC101801 TaxID=3364103 RepID=UPI00381C8A51
MGSVLVHVASAEGTAVSLELGPGEVTRFGRGCAEQPVGIVLPDPAVPRLAGEIRAAEDHWQLSNFSSSLSYVVENPEGAGEYIRIAPRRVGAPVPFEFARVVLPTQGATQSFQVYAPAHTYYDAPPRPQSAGPATLMAFPLDESATYFLVLVALCEPRLRDLSVPAVPTTRQVVERLRTHPGCHGISEPTVSFHIDYLARNKLRVRQPENGGRMDGKREAVVSLALRFGLVREDHLALLPARPATRLETS